MQPEKTSTFNIPSRSYKRTEDLSVEELRTLPWFKDHSDEELASIIEAAKRISRVVFDVHMKQKKTDATRTKTISITQRRKAA